MQSTTEDEDGIISITRGDETVKRNFKTGLIAGGLFGIAVTAGIGGAAFYATDGFTNMTMEKDKLRLRPVNQNIRSLESMIDEEYLYNKENEDLEQFIYKGLLEGLGDPYSQYYTSSEYKQLEAENTGNYCGIGVRITQEHQSKETSVTEVYKGSPASEAGLKEGDLLEEVDEADVSKMDINDIVNDHILGEEGSTVKIKVYRPSTDQTLTLEIARRQVEAEYVRYEMLENGIGYIRITSFAAAAAGQFTTAVNEIKNQGAESMIIDLRSNPGGDLDSVVEITAGLLPDGKLVYTKDKYGKGEEYYSKNGSIYYKSDYGMEENGYPKKDGGQSDLPMAVLINQDSASASEIFAQLMKDYKAAVIVGTKSFGKGIVQQVFPFDDGSAVKLTVSSYFTKNGDVIQGNGVTPDITAEQNKDWADSEHLPPHEEDLQLQEAVKQLSK